MGSDVSWVRIPHSPPWHLSESRRCLFTTFPANPRACAALGRAFPRGRSSSHGAFLCAPSLPCSCRTGIGRPDLGFPCPPDMGVGRMQVCGAGWTRRSLLVGVAGARSSTRRDGIHDRERVGLGRGRRRRCPPHGAVRAAMRRGVAVTTDSSNRSASLAEQGPGLHRTIQDHTLQIRGIFYEMMSPWRNVSTAEPTQS